MRSRRDGSGKRGTRPLSGHAFYATGANRAETAASGKSEIAVRTTRRPSKLLIRALAHLPWCDCPPSSKTLAAVVSTAAEMESAASAEMGMATTSRTAAMGATTPARASSVMLRERKAWPASKSYRCDGCKEET